MKDYPLEDLLYDFIRTVSWHEIDESEYSWDGVFRVVDLQKWLVENGKKGKLRVNFTVHKYKIPLDFSVKKGYVDKLTSESIVKNCLKNCYPERKLDKGGTVSRCFSYAFYSKSGKNCKEYPNRIRNSVMLKSYKKDSKRRFYKSNFYSKIEVPDEIRGNIDEMCDYLAETGAKILLSKKKYLN